MTLEQLTLLALGILQEVHLNRETLMKYIAWGAGKLLELYVAEKKDHGVISCIDSNSTRSNILGVPVVRPDDINFGNLDGAVIVIFAISSAAVQSIFQILTLKGLKYGKDFILYSALFFFDFAEKLYFDFGLQVDKDTCRQYEAFVLNSIKPHHTTVLGTVLLDAVINRIHQESVPGMFMEVGAFEGGNALALLMLNKHAASRRYYVMDSFEGFPEVSDLDPSRCGAGDYATKTPYEQILNGFAEFDNIEVIRGFVPTSFANLPEDSVFSLVFYDCDLYLPALDTFKFAWNKLSPGGYMVVHDYCSETGGYEGVKAAVDEYFEGLPVTVVDFFENTMAVIQKPLVEESIA
ncbi:MAG: TylF/MycF/NovP-related O-methyltransferase [Methylobacter sp.]